MHRFFVVHGNKLVAESCHFSSWEPHVLKRSEVDAEPVWNSDPYVGAALEMYWYRRFYTETLNGQLMVLRPDQPILYHYERPDGRDILRVRQYVTLLKTYRLLCVALPLLVAIVFPSIEYVMAIAAAALGASFLLLWWRARKIDES
jgi:hypothetical protein